MENKTAVEYLISVVKSPEWQDMYIWHKEEVFKTALAMGEKDMLNAFSAGINCEFGNGPNFEQWIKKYKQE
jgi:hypothetical protein